jgi:16S rRNA (uracil1498-N3)-methyltransferase
MADEGAAAGLSTTGPHLFVDSIGDDELTITGDEAHHLHTVLRVRTGEPVSLADGAGSMAQAIVRRTDRTAVTVEVDRRFDVPPNVPQVVVLQAVPKGKKMEEVVQRLTELGVDRLVPVVTARTVKQVGGKADKVIARWEGVAESAARQSRRARRLQIDPLTSWPVPGVRGAILHEQATVPLAHALQAVLADPPSEIVLAIGPEGGFEGREVDEAEGLSAALLGPTVLRTETAGLAAASVLLHHLGRLG